jgi:hypothetical protein
MTNMGISSSKPFGIGCRAPWLSFPSIQPAGAGSCHQLRRSAALTGWEPHSRTRKMARPSSTCCRSFRLPLLRGSFERCQQQR